MAGNYAQNLQRQMDANRQRRNQDMVRRLQDLLIYSPSPAVDFRGQPHLKMPDLEGMGVTAEPREGAFPQGILASELDPDMIEWLRSQALRAQETEQAAQRVPGYKPPPAAAQMPPQRRRRSPMQAAAMEATLPSIFEADTGPELF